MYKTYVRTAWSAATNKPFKGIGSYTPMFVYSVLTKSLYSKFSSRWYCRSCTPATKYNTLFSTKIPSMTDYILLIFNMGLNLYTFSVRTNVEYLSKNGMFYYLLRLRLRLRLRIQVEADKGSKLKNLNDQGFFEIFGV